MRALATVTLLALLTPLAAQGNTSPFKLVPADCCAFARIAGPAAWTKEYAATGLGKLMASPAMAPVRERLAKVVDTAIGDLGGDAAAVRAIRDMLLGYRGDAVIAAHVDFDDIAAAFRAERRPACTVALILGPDGHTDLAALVAKAGPLIEQIAPADVRELQAAGGPLRFVTTPAGQLSLPRLQDGCAVVLFGNDLAASAERFLAVPADRALTPAPELQRGTFALQLEFERALAAVRLVNDPAGPDYKRELDVLLQGLGLDSIRGLSYVSYADGEHWVQCGTLDFPRGPRGLLEVVVPAGVGKPKLLQYLPDTAENFSLVAFDATALYRTLVDIVDQLGDDAPMKRRQLEEEFTEACKVRLFDDLVAHVGGEYLRVDDLVGKMQPGDEDDSGDAEKARDRLGHACLAIDLKDGKAFAKGLETALRARGLHATRKLEEYGAFRIYRLVLLGTIEVEYAVTDELWLLGIGGGDGTKRNLRAVLDRLVARRAGKPARELPAAAIARLQLMPDDWHNLDVLHVPTLVDGFEAALEQLRALATTEEVELDDELGNWMVLFDVARALRAEVGRLGIDTAVTTMSLGRDRIVMRARW